MRPQHSFAYEHSDIPPGVTLAQWRRSTAAGRHERTPSVRALVRRICRHPASRAARSA